ncbi:unnamed protein product [Blepharisma stoltei]|uniref:Uncharacterized protein n=1 Tax=Blepharisma stoltei TaxID=1481888 RepID=A0AAU9IUR5_9CILI|nr:unnamed protein product [Blepharisma stoltei]
MSFCGVKKIAKLNSKNLGTRIKDIKINEELHLFLVMDQLGLQKHHIYCNANKQRIICFNSWSEDPITFDKLLFTKVY